MVNDAPIRFVVDTGATDLVLSPADAARAGIDPDGLIFSGQAFTANGMVETAPVLLDTVALEGTADTRVARGRERRRDARQPSGDELPAALRRLEISEGRLVLERARRAPLSAFIFQLPVSSDQYFAAAPAPVSVRHCARAVSTAPGSWPSKRIMDRVCAATSSRVTSAPSTETRQSGVLPAGPGGQEHRLIGVMGPARAAMGQEPVAEPELPVEPVEHLVGAAAHRHAPGLGEGFLQKDPQRDLQRRARQVVEIRLPHLAPHSS
jgi:clan AA aspartic protease (TIGR02281 family)